MLVVTLLEVCAKEEGVVVLHIPIGPLKHALGWSWYRDSNPVPTSPLADDGHYAISAGFKEEKAFRCQILFINSLKQIRLLHTHILIFPFIV